MALVLSVLAGCGGSDGPGLYVDPEHGSDENTGTEADPFKTIQRALDVVKPGTTVRLAEGVYREHFETKVDGTEDAPITIQGPESGMKRADRYRAVVTDESRVVMVNNDHYVLDGFTVDGQPGLQAGDYPAEMSEVDRFRGAIQGRAANSRLVYIGSDDEATGVTGVVVRNMFLNGSGGECVRLRNGAHGNTIADSVIQFCGLYGENGYHNGEGVYIGTSPKSEDQPMPGSDEGHDNTVSNTIIRTFGTECLDVKESAHDNVFVNNECSGNLEGLDEGGSLIELRGYDNSLTGNRIVGSLGYGVKIRADGDQYDNGGNRVRDNHISDTEEAPVFIRSSSRQGEICGNDIQGGTNELNGFRGNPSAPC